MPSPMEWVVLLLEIILKRLGMATKQGAPAKQASKATKARKRKTDKAHAAATSQIPGPVAEFLKRTSIPKGFVNKKPMALSKLQKRLNEMDLRPTVSVEQLLTSAN